MIISIIYLLIFVGVIAAIYNFLNTEDAPHIDEAEHHADSLDEELAAAKEARKARAKERREKARKAKKE